MEKETEQTEQTNPKEEVTTEQPTETQPTETQKPKTTPPPLPKVEVKESNEEMPGWAKSLMQKVDALQAEREQSKADARQREIDTIIEPLSDTLKSIYKRSDYKALTDEQFNELKGTIEEEVNKLSTTETAKKAAFVKPMASSGKSEHGKASDEEIKEVIKRLNI